MLTKLPEDFDRSKINVLGRRYKKDLKIVVSRGDFKYMEKLGFNGYFAVKTGKYCGQTAREQTIEEALTSNEMLAVFTRKRGEICDNAVVVVKKAFIDGDYVVMLIEKAV